MRYYNGNYIRSTDQNVDKSNVNGLFNLEAQLIHKAEDRWAGPINVDPTADWVEFSRRLIESDVYMNGNTDYDGPYDVSDVVVPATFSGSARIYLGHKNSIVSGSVYYADTPVACIQILNSAGNSLLKSWNWHSDSSQGWENLGTATAVSGAQAVGFPETLAASAARTYGQGVSGSNSHLRWSYQQGTGSSNTGAADGIGAAYSENGVDGGSGTILPSPGNGVVNQASNSSFLYRETSSSERYSGVVARSSAYTFSGGEIIRIAHAMTGYSAAPMNADDTMYIGVA